MFAPILLPLKKGDKDFCGQLIVTTTTPIHVTVQLNLCALGHQSWPFLITSSHSFKSHSHIPTWISQSFQNQETPNQFHLISPLLIQSYLLNGSCNQSPMTRFLVKKSFNSTVCFMQFIYKDVPDFLPSNHFIHPFQG